MGKSRRRIRGEGAVYRRKSDQRWTGSFKLEGMSKRKYVYAPANNNTEQAANNLLKKAMREYEQGTLATGKGQKLKDYLVDWFENVHKPTVRIGGYASQRVHVYKHLIPSLGEIDLRKLTAQRLQQFYTEKGNARLSAQYLKNIHSTLSRAIDNAVKWKLVPENVCDQVTLPKVEKHEQQVLTKDQIIRLVEVANASAMGPFIKLGLMSGLRHGEILALRWSNIDFETDVLSVVHTVSHPGLGLGAVEGDAKTEEGIRRIILPQFVLDALKVHRERQQEQRQAAGEKWQDKGLIFCNRYGTFRNPEWDLVLFRRVLKEAGLPEIMCKTMRIHDLRHNVATFLINVLKYPPNFVQALLGHSDIATTLRLYVKNDPEVLRQMMDDLNDLFGGKSDIARIHDLRQSVVMFLASAFKYPSHVTQALLRNDPEALQQLMSDLSNLLGGHG